MFQVSYEVAAPAASREVVHLLAKVFSESEPPAVAMTLSYLEMVEFLDLIVPEILRYGLTIAVRERDTSALAGVLLTDDFALPHAIEPTLISPKFLPILSLLETLDEQYRRIGNVAPGECLHLFMLGVDGEFAGRGLAQGLVAACCDNGQRRRYRKAVTEATGRISQRVFRKNGFDDRFKVSYQDFVHEGQAVFASIKEHDGALLMERSLHLKSQ